MPLFRPDPECGCAGGDGARAEDARRRAKSGGRKTAGPAYINENLDLLRAGFPTWSITSKLHANLASRWWWRSTAFATDTQAELELVRKAAIEEGGAEDAVVASTGNWAAKAQWIWPKPWSKRPRNPSNFKFLYPLELSIKEKIEIIAREVYGADGVDYCTRS